MPMVPMAEELMIFPSDPQFLQHLRGSESPLLGRLHRPKPGDSPDKVFVGARVALFTSCLTVLPRPMLAGQGSKI